MVYNGARRIGLGHVAIYLAEIIPIRLAQVDAWYAGTESFHSSRTHISATAMCGLQFAHPGPGVSTAQMP